MIWWRWNSTTFIFEISTDNGSTWNPPTLEASVINAGTMDAARLPALTALAGYSEGTWTPTIIGSGGSTGQTYTKQEGHYIKIGKLVAADFDIVLSNKGTITSIVQIGALPFTVSNDNNFLRGRALSYWTALTNAFVFISALPIFNSTVASLYGATAAAVGLSSLAQADLSNTSELVGTLIYRATA